MNLTIKNINKENFYQYGQLISTKDVNSENINSDTTKSFYDLVDIEILGDNNQCRINIFKAKKRQFPLEINMLENHPFSSQSFIPLQNTSFIVVVAPISNTPDLKLLEAFKVPSEEGINLRMKLSNELRNEYIQRAAIYGNKDTLKDPLYHNKDYDYICYTDNKELKSNVWKVWWFLKVFY